MQVQVNTGKGIENKEGLERWATEHLSDHLARFSQDITRVEVQLSSKNSSAKGGADVRCMLEARMAGVDPLAVNHHASTQDEAFRGASQRLAHLLDHTLGKTDRTHRDRGTIRKDAQAFTQET